MCANFGLLTWFLFSVFWRLKTMEKCMSVFTLYVSYEIVNFEKEAIVFQFQKYFTFLY